MTTVSDEITRLREAFAACASPPVGDCPPPEKIWEALHGELPPGDFREVVDHTAACASCAADWRLAHAFDMQSGDATAVPERAVRRVRFQTLQPWLAAAAAAVVLVVGFQWNEWMSRDEPALRDGTEQTAIVIHSLIPENQPLSRQHCLLRWSGPEEATYNIEISTEQLEIIPTTRDLRTSAYLVPESSLAKHPAATKLIWRVEAVLPDGSSVHSMTFITMLE